MPTISPAVLDKLRTFDTPTICNIIELFDMRPRTEGYMDARIRACFPDLPPSVGFAATATCRTAHRPRRTDAYSSMAEQADRFGELSGQAFVVFQDLDNPVRAATFGELMCTTYKTFGAVGLITNGPGRDLDQIHAIGFPVFTEGANASHGYIHIIDLHVPVEVGGLTVYADDLLHADRNGITNIPHEIASEVADVGDAFVAAENVILTALREPGITVERLRAAIKESKAQQAVLAAQVGRKRP